METLVVLLIAALIYALVQLSKQQKIAHGVKDADDYSAEIRQDSDDYSARTRKDADDYSKTIREDADECAENTQKKADKYVESLDNKIAEKKQECKQIQEQIRSLNKELNNLEKDVIIQSVDISDYDNMKSDEVKNKLTLLKNKQENLIKTDKALTIKTMDRTKREINNQKKQILRCFNSDVNDIIEHISVKNVDTSRSKIERAFTSINKIFEVDGVKITQELLELKLEELSLVYAYELKLNEEREQRKAIKAQMVEEEKVRREIEKAKKKLDKDEAQFNSEVKKLMSYMQKAKDDVERNLYLDKIKDLEGKLSELQSERENVLNREQNAKAGFVYIISNIGSFGENIFKIGMTRRLEPMDRIKELSSASVPFVFDVHAMIFSDDAPALEATLHEVFDKYRVNKVNYRKEFFHVDLEEIKRIVHEKHNATTKFIDIPDATEYRETLRFEQQKEIV